MDNVKNVLSDIPKEILGFIGLVVLAIPFLMVIDQIKKIFPNTSPLLFLAEFLIRLLIDWGAPDPNLWFMRFLIIIAGIFGAYNYFSKN